MKDVVEEGKEVEWEGDCEGYIVEEGKEVGWEGDCEGYCGGGEGGRVGG